MMDTLHADTTEGVRIRPVRPGDYPAIRAIYQAGIDTGMATFETEAPEWRIWNRKFPPPFRLVALDQNKTIAGWAALSPVSSRRVYGGVQEVSIYIHPDYYWRGFGRYLLDELIRRSEAGGVWTLQAVIFPENAASLHLHRILGFRDVGRRERIGQLNGRWHDTLLLERRSVVAGVS
jgi:phosphinothricin acetyltransferase